MISPVLLVDWGSKGGIKNKNIPTLFRKGCCHGYNRTLSNEYKLWKTKQNVFVQYHILFLDE